MLGDRLVPVAIAFAVLDLTGSVTDLGIVLAAQVLPFAVFLVAGGVWADRLPRHRVMLASDLVRALAQALLAGLLLGGVAHVWELIALQAVYGSAEAFFRPAMTGLVPQVASAPRLQQANALLALSSNIANVLGPAFAGVLVALLAPGGALVFDAATFLVSAAFLLRLRPAAFVRVEPPGRFLAEVVAGFREVRSRSWVWATVGGFGFYALVVLPCIFVLGPALSKRELGGASAWATIVAGFGLGALGGSALALRVKPRRPVFVCALLILVGSCQPAIIASRLPLLGIAALELVTGIAISYAFSVWDTTLQERIPAHALSRVSSFDFLGSTALMPVGLALIGPLAAVGGLHRTMVVASAVGIAIAAVIAVSPAIRRESG